MRVRSWVACVLLSTSGLAVAAMPAAAATPSSSSLWPLTDLAAQRVQIADKVAAAKFGTTQPIDDPVREQQILNDVAAKAAGLGLDPATTVRFFRDQIEANKVVQRGLYARWTAHPEEQPTVRPDLATEVRPIIDRLNAGLLDQFAATVAVRASHTCDLRLVITTRVVDLRRHLDRLHQRALVEAVQSVCG
ncbi:chorismate mutase [Amycolatopsis xylanica]|uniref:chorismate mutase n=1 Tax=Amycolatopsis xylanica TaxID=589385 RepID=UPI000B84ED90|nr:chorismate mutase [Amycolatopsis xylanica]